MTELLQRLRQLASRAVGAMRGLTDADDAARAIMRRVAPFTMTSQERLFGLIQAVRYIERAAIPGCVVECGVWRGGSSMAAALTLLETNSAHREIHLFDTFEGMSAPTAHDTDWRGRNAVARFARARQGAQGSSWCYASIEDVTTNMNSTGYETGRVRLIKGKVEETIPAQAPRQIALLRLDTDWYESTRHEFEHLYPRLAPGGVLIIDDYGYWQGARRATDEYLASNHITLLLNRLDNTGRIAIKP